MNLSALLQPPADLPKYRSVYQIGLFAKQARRRETLYVTTLRTYDLMTYHLERTVFDDQFCLPCVAGKKLRSSDRRETSCEVLGVSTGNVRD